ncbi:pseudaminic acid cytidylyltransferase [Vibrio toranzoniae]|uniref:pseudaminic acid cytidylyltransferase n=1 Tax=Vibrio toranzoniae TaxID=1194427 RepID=UPI001376C146|nr:pseudaminic acid cytidylyltransferase [Vibrio toranzoniae]NAZ46789.1 pseudaminic acid cytidylyltransferase [Vibrio toranzoniae]
MKIAIIPARGGSKRIPRKNIKLFCGKPIISYSIESARQSGCFDRVIVSTDDVEIAEIAKTYGAEVPYVRSAKSSDDYASLHDVVVEVLTQLTESVSVAHVALILPTSPLLSADTIRTVMDYLGTEEYDSALTVVEYEVSPDKALTLSDSGSIVRQDSNQLMKRSQEHMKCYHDAGQIYAFYADDVRSRKTLTGKRCKAVILDHMDSHDIDTPNHWLLAEMKYKLSRE